MLTRRFALGAGLCGVVSLASYLGGSYFGSFGAEERPSDGRTLNVPPGACDAHVHVIGDPRRFPMSPDRDYTPPPATATQLQAALRSLGFERVVIVTPTIYGMDNSATLDAIKEIGPQRARGVALIGADTSPPTLDALKEGGIGGIRLLIFGGEHFHPAVAKKKIAAWYELAGKQGWHIDLSAPPDVVAAVLPELNASPVPLVLDYFGWLAGGPRQPGRDAVLALVGSGRAYIKLAEPYRLTNDRPDYPDLLPVVQLLLQSNPDRILWGSGWPHVDSANGRNGISPNIPVTNKHLFQLFQSWVSDPKLQRKILVENPARLYGFA